MLRSMSVIPYLDDLHNPCFEEDEPEQDSRYDESYSAGRSHPLINSSIEYCSICMNAIFPQMVHLKNF